MGIKSTASDAFNEALTVARDTAAKTGKAVSDIAKEHPRTTVAIVTVALAAAAAYVASRQSETGSSLSQDADTGVGLLGLAGTISSAILGENHSVESIIQDYNDIYK